MVRENQCIGNNHILPPRSSKHNHLRNIITSQRLHALVHLLRLLLVAAKPHDAELGLDLPGIDLDDADAARDQLLAQRVGEAAHRGLGRAVDAAALVGLAARNRADVYDVAAAAVRAGQEERQDGLGHGDQACDVGLEHDVDVGLGDFGGLVDALDEAAELGVSRRTLFCEETAVGEDGNRKKRTRC